MGARLRRCALAYTVLRPKTVSKLTFCLLLVISMISSNLIGWRRCIYLPKNERIKDNHIVVVSRYGNKTQYFPRGRPR